MLPWASRAEGLNLIGTARALPPSHFLTTILGLYNRCIADAEVAELADAPALGAGGRKAVGVRVPSSAFIFALIISSNRRQLFRGLDSTRSPVYFWNPLSRSYGRHIFVR